MSRALAASIERPRRVAPRRASSIRSREWALTPRNVMADSAVLATVAAVVGLFAISPVLLEAHGIAYISSGGGIFSKVHPSTLAALAALGLRCLASPRPLRTGWRLLTDDKGVVVLLASVVVTAFAAVVIAKSPVTPLIDTFVLPVLVFLLLRDLDPAIVRWIALLVTLVLCLNAVLAMIEFLRGTHFVSIPVPPGTSPDPTRGDVVFDWRAELALDWRATALLGHPLVNGLIVGSFILCLAAPGSRWLPMVLKLPILLLQIGSMATFGARTALALSILFLGWLVLGQIVEAIGRGVRPSARQIGVALLAIVLAVGIAAVVVQTGFLDRTADRFHEDAGSASTRITMFNLFTPLSPVDLLFGPDKDVVATWQRLEGLEFGIESSWIGLVLNYGLIVTAIIVLGLAAFSRSVILTCGRGTALILVFYFILISVSASMSGKTTTFAMVVALSLIFLRRDENRRPLWSAMRVGLV